MSSLGLVALAVFGLQSLATTALAQTNPPIVVNSTYDGTGVLDPSANDTNPGDGLADYDPITPGEQTSLRAAIQEAAARPGADTILFDPAAFANPATITIWSPLKVANGTTLTIDGGTNKVTIAAHFTTLRQLSIGDNTGSGANTTLNNLTIANGGGIYVSMSATLTVNNALFLENGVNLGAGIWNGGGTLTVNNSIFSGNKATVPDSSGSDGGGILNGGTATVINCIFVQNTATLGGAIYNPPGATLYLGNTYIGPNPTANSTPLFGGTFISLGYNAFAGGAQITMIGDTTSNITVHDADDQFLPLAYNGGPTRTYALSPTSWLIDKGKRFGPAFDQRGVPRPYDDPLIPNAVGGDGTDIGPFETHDPVVPLVINATDDTDDGVCDSHCSLREAINLFRFGLAVRPITFDPAVFTPSGSHTIQLTRELPNLGHRTTILGPGANVLTVRGQGQGLISSYSIFTLTGGRSAYISGLTVANGFADDHIPNAEMIYGGGGIMNLGMLTLEGVTVSGNRTKEGFPGGGIYNGGMLTMSRSVISGNQTGNGGSGGGIFNTGTLTIRNSTVSNNQTGTGSGGVNTGGGIQNSGGTANIIDSTVSGNSASGNANNRGGGIFNGNSGLVRITGSTVSGNSVSGTGINFGGGIHNETNGTVTLASSTVSDNSASGGDSITSFKAGGGIFNNGGTVNARNTIIAGNSASTSAPDFSGALASQGYNLIGSTTAVTITGDTTGNVLNQNALLGPLQNNGGPTLTHAPLDGSPAIDAGSNADLLDFDQRGAGFPRALGTTVDIGAVESPYFRAFAAADTAHRQPGRTIKISLATLLANDLSPAARPLTVTAVGATSSGGVPLQVLNGVVLYAPAAGFNANDTFTYTADNGLHTITGTVSVVVDAPVETVTQNILNTSFSPGGGGQMSVFAAVIPGRSYVLQATGSLTSPVTWSDIGGPQVGTETGQAVFIENNPPSPRFYRVVEAITP